jgi:hypothetical protein
VANSLELVDFTGGTVFLVVPRRALKGGSGVSGS